jgi:hypothetical protein
MKKSFGFPLSISLALLVFAGCAKHSTGSIEPSNTPAVAQCLGFPSLQGAQEVNLDALVDGAQGAYRLVYVGVLNETINKTTGQKNRFLVSAQLPLGADLNTQTLSARVECKDITDLASPSNPVIHTVSHTIDRRSGTHHGEVRLSGDVVHTASVKQDSVSAQYLSGSRVFYLQHMVQSVDSLKIYQLPNGRFEFRSDKTTNTTSRESRTQSRWVYEFVN